MDAETVHDTTVSVVDGDPGGDIEEMSNDKGTLDGFSFDNEVIREVGSALIRLELDSACASEKLVNMNLLMMHVAARESDIEAFATEKEDTLVDSDAKVLEFDVLSGIFDSEVREMDKFVCSLEREINNACEIISSYKHLGDALSPLEEKLHDAEESMKQSKAQVSELLIQSAKFQRILPGSNRDEAYADKDVVVLEDGDFFKTNAKIKMQTSEQQQHILRMLEKSLAQELDLEKKLTECTQALDEMKHRLYSSKQEILSLEEETASVHAQFLEADNASSILMGISKELVGQIQSCQLTINSAVHRESELNSRLQNCMETVQRLERKEIVLQELADKNNSGALILKEKVNILEEQLKSSQVMLLNEKASNSEGVKELQERIAIAEIRAEKAEDECKSLAETNKGLNEELGLLKDSGISSEKVDSLEKQLVETNFQLEQAMTTVEASQEKQNMLDTSIIDMDNLIKKLKSKASEAEARADSVEDKCILLSELNEELNEELKCLRGKLERSEASVQRAEEMKLATAKDINIRTKMITDLVMQLAVERERLHKQIHLLMNENRALVDKLDMASKVTAKSKNFEGEENEKVAPSSEHHEGSADTGRANGEVSDTTEVKLPKEVLEVECEPDSQDLESKLEAVRTIDAGRLSMKHLLFAILTAVITVLAVCFLQPQNCPL